VAEDGPQVGKVQAAVQRMQRGRRDETRRLERQVVDMRVNDVEGVSALERQPEVADVWGSGGDDPLAAAIEVRRHPFRQWRDSDPHAVVSPQSGLTAPLVTSTSDVFGAGG
jgi:hypothetical protein